jgi:hypothetical protein
LVVKGWPGGVKGAPKLVAEGLWAKVVGGYQFVEWPEFCTRKKVQAKPAGIGPTVSVGWTARAAA